MQEGQDIEVPNEEHAMEHDTVQSDVEREIIKKSENLRAH